MTSTNINGNIGTFGTLTVGGQSVCLANGTNCVATSSWLGNIQWNNATGTNTTSTNLAVTGITSVNGVSFTSATGTSIQTTSGTIGTLGFRNATGTDLFVTTGRFGTVTSTSVYANSATIGWLNAVSSTFVSATATTLTVTGSIQNSIATTSQFQIMSTIDLDSDTSVVKVIGKYAYTGGFTDQVFRIIDVSIPTAPTSVGSVAVGGTPYDIAISGQYAYVTRDDAGDAFVVINISNPRSPQVVRTVDAVHANLKGVSVYGGYLYISFDSGAALEIYDISNPADPKLIRSVTGFGNATANAIRENYLYAVTSGGLATINISNPATASLVGTISFGTYNNDIEIQGRYAYVSDWNGYVHVVDIASSTAPVLRASVNVGAGAMNVSVGGRYAFVALQDAGVAVVDISNPLNPTLVNVMDAGGTEYAMDVSGRYLYVSNGSGLGTSFSVIKIPGADLVSANIDSLEAGFLSVLTGAQIGTDLRVGGYLDVGYGGILSNGAITVVATTTPSVFMGGVSSTAVTVNGVSVCLANGTNCVAESDTLLSVTNRGGIATSTSIYFYGGVTSSRITVTSTSALADVSFTSATGTSIQTTSGTIGTLGFGSATGSDLFSVTGRFTTSTIGRLTTNSINATGATGTIQITATTTEFTGRVDAPYLNRWFQSTDLTYRTYGGAATSSGSAGASIFDGTYIWLSSGTYLQKVDPYTNSIIAQIDVGGWAMDQIATDGRYVYAQMGDVMNQTVKVDAYTNTIVATSTHTGTRVMYADGSLWITNGSTILEVDPTTLLTTATTTLGTSEYMVYDGSYIWFGSGGDMTISKLDPRTNQIVATVGGGRMVQPRYLAFDGSYVWVGDVYVTDPVILKVDVNTNEIVATIDIPGVDIADLLYAGGYVWAIDVNADQLLKIDPTTNAIISRMTIANLNAGSLAYDGVYLWVTTDDTILRIPTGTGASNIFDLGMDFRPTTNTAFDIGTASSSWRNIYASGTAYLANVSSTNLTVGGQSVCLANGTNCVADSDTLLSVTNRGGIATSTSIYFYGGATTSRLTATGTTSLQGVSFTSATGTSIQTTSGTIATLGFGSATGTDLFSVTGRFTTVTTTNLFANASTFGTLTTNGAATFNGGLTANSTTTLWGNVGIGIAPSVTNALTVNGSVNVVGSGAVTIVGGPWESSGTNETVNEVVITTTGPSYLLLGVTAHSSGATDEAVTSVTGGGLTWTRLAGGTVAADPAYTSEFWGAYAPTALSSVTVTTTFNHSSNIGLSVLGLSGVNLVDPVGLTVGQAETGQDLSVTFTGATSGSRLFAVSFTKPYEFGSLTAGAGTTVYSHILASQHIRSTNAVAAGNHTISSTGYVTATNNEYVGVEILASGASVTAESGIFTNLTVNSQQVCLANGTNCVAESDTLLSVTNRGGIATSTSIYFYGGATTSRITVTGTSALADVSFTSATGTSIQTTSGTIGTLGFGHATGTDFYSTVLRYGTASGSTSISNSLISNIGAIGFLGTDELYSASSTVGFLNFDSATGTDLFVTTGRFTSVTSSLVYASQIYTSNVTSSGNLIFTPNGNVGVGTSTPSEKLTVLGGISNVMASSSDASQLSLLSTKSIGLGDSAGVALAIQNNYLYVVDFGGNQFKIVDISNPGNPTVLSTSTVSGAIRDIKVAGQYAYMTDASNDAVLTFDVSDVRNPIQTATTTATTAGYQARGIDIVGGYLYVTGDFYGAGAGGDISTFDLSDPAHPVRIYNSGSGGGAGSILAQGKYLYAGLSGEMSVYDNTDKTSPVQVSVANATTSAGIHQMVADGRYVYAVISGGSGDVALIDISSSTHPVTLREFGPASNHSKIFKFGRYLVTSGWTNGAMVYDVSNPSNPIQVAILGSGTAIAQGRHLYLVNYDNSNVVMTYVLPGIETTAINAGSARIGSFSAEYGFIDNSFIVGNGLNVGYGGILSNGAILVSATSTPSIFMGGVSSTAVTVNGVSVCLQNGTNCPASTEIDTLLSVTNRGGIATSTSIYFYGGATTSRLNVTGTTALAGVSFTSATGTSIQTTSGTIGTLGFGSATGTDLFSVTGRFTTSTINRLTTNSINATGATGTIQITATSTIVNGRLDAFGLNRWFQSPLLSQSLFGFATSTIDVGTRPMGIAFDGTYVWVTNSQGAGISKIDPKTNTVIATVADTGVVNLAYGANAVWATNRNDGWLDRINLETNTFEAVIDTGSSVEGIVYDGRYFWVSTGTNVRKFDPTTNTFVQTIAVGTRTDWDVFGMTFDGKNVWVSTNVGLSKISATSSAIIGTVSISPGVHSLAFDGAYLWATNNASGTVVKIDVDTNQIVASVPTVTGVYPGIVFDGNYIWTGDNGSNTVVKIDVRTNSIVATSTVGANPNGMVFDGTYVWISNYYGDSVSKIWAGGAGGYGANFLVNGQNVCLANGTNCPASTEIDTLLSVTSRGGVATSTSIYFYGGVTTSRITVTGTSALADVSFTSATGTSIQTTSGTIGTLGFGSATGTDLFVTTGRFATVVAPTIYASNVTSTGNIAFTMNGNLGVGTSTPSEKLTVVGNIQNTMVTGQQLALKGSVQLPQYYARSVAAEGDYAYITNEYDGNGFVSVYDVSSSTPVLVGSLAQFSKGLQGIAVGGGYAYVANATSNTISVIDIRNPASMRIVGEVGVGIGPDNVVLSGKYLYVGNNDSDNSTGSSSISIVDVSDPLHPVVASTTVRGGTGATDIAVSGNYLYAVGFYGNSSIFDVSDPLNPVRIGGFTPNVDNPTEMRIQGRYAYIVGYDYVMGIMDLSNATSPLAVSTVSSVGWHLAVSGRYAYGSNYYGAIRTVDVADPTRPLVLSTTTSTDTEHILAVSGNNLLAPGVYNFNVFRIPGTETASLLAHSLEAGSLQVLMDGYIGNRLSVGEGLNVGYGGILSRGALAVSATSTLQHVFTSANNTYDLGSATYSWRDIYASGTARLTNILASSLSVGGQSVCLQNGTNCPVAGSDASWTFDGTTNVVRLATTTNSFGLGGTTESSMPFFFRIQSTSSRLLLGANGSSTDVVIGAGTSTITNGMFQLDGNDLFVAGNIGSASSIYTNAAFVAGTTTAYGASMIQSLDATGTLSIVATSTIFTGRVDADYLSRWFQSPLTAWGIGKGATSFTLGGFPEGMVFDGAYVWVARYGDNAVSKINTITNRVVANVPVGTSPTGMAFDGRNVWVANFGDGTVSKIQAGVGKVVATTTVGTNPREIAFDGTFMWVTNNGSDTVSKVNATSGVVAATVNVGDGPTGIAFDGNHMWVANRTDDTVSKINVSTNAVDATVAVGDQAHGVAFDGRYVWVTNRGADTVSKIDPATDTVIATVSVGDQPYMKAFDGDYLWVSNFGNSTVSVIDVNTNAVADTRSTPFSPTGIAYDGISMWIAGNDGDIGKLQASGGSYGSQYTIGTDFVVAGSSTVAGLNFSNATGSRLVVTSLAVNGQSVCLQSGTNCPASTEIDTLLSVTNRGGVATSTSIYFYGGVTTSRLTVTSTMTFTSATGTDLFATSGRFGTVTSTNVYANTVFTSSVTSTGDIRFTPNGGDVLFGANLIPEATVVVRPTLGLHAASLEWIDDTHVRVTYDWTDANQLLDWTPTTDATLTRGTSTVSVTGGSTDIHGMVWKRQIAASSVTGRVNPLLTSHVNIYTNLDSTWVGTPWSPTPSYGHVWTDTSFFTIDGGTSNSGGSDVVDSDWRDYAFEASPTALRSWTSIDSTWRTYNGTFVQAVTSSVAVGSFGGNNEWGTIVIEGEVTSTGPVITYGDIGSAVDSWNNIFASGTAYLANAVVSSTFTVGGQNVCLQNGTNCPAGTGTPTLLQVTNMGGVATSTSIYFYGGVTSSRITVTGTSALADVSFTSATGTSIQTTSGTIGTLGFGNATGTDLFVTSGRFGTAYTSTVSSTGDLILNANGYVGIGTSTPSEKLTVVGNIQNTMTSTTLPAYKSYTSFGGSTYNVAGLVAQGDYIYMIAGISQGQAVFGVYNMTNGATGTAVGGVTYNGVEMRDIAVAGNYVYLANFTSSSLVIVDAANPAAPVTVGSVRVNAAVREVEVQGGYAYLAVEDENTQHFVNVVDISNPASPRTVATTTVGNAHGISVQGSYAYVCGIYAVCTIIDISDPTNPRVRDTFATAFDGIYNMTVQGSYAYVPNDTNNLQVYNISNPDNAILVGSTLVRNNDLVKPFISGRYLYVNSSAGNSIDIVDVASSSNPFRIGTIALPSNNNAPQSMYVQGRYLYVGGINGITTYVLPGMETSALLTHSIETGELQAYNGYFNNAVKIDGGLAVGYGGILSSGPMVVTATSTPSIFMGGVSSTAVTVNGVSVCLANGTNCPASTEIDTLLSVTNRGGVATSTSIYFYGGVTSSRITVTGTSALADVSFTSATGTDFFSTTGRFNTVTGTTMYANTATFGAVTVAGQTVCLGNSVGCPAGVGVPSLAQVTNVGSYTTSTSLYFYGGATSSNLYVTGTIDNALKATSTFKLLSSGLVTDADPMRVKVAGDYAYVVGTGGDTLQVIDVSNPSYPRILSRMAVANDPVDIEIVGKYAYTVSNAGAAMNIIDISNPTALRMMSTTTLSNQSTGITVAGGYAYIFNDWGASVDIYNITDPQNPRLVRVVAGTGYAIDGEIRGNYIYYGRDTGMGVLDITNPEETYVIGGLTVGAYPARVAIQGRYAYLSDDGVDALYTVDISNPTVPVVVATTTGFGTNTADVTVQGRYAYVSTFGNGFAVVDIASSTNPFVVQRLNPGDWTYSLAISGQNIYAIFNGGDEFWTYQIPGIETTALTSGGIESGTLHVRSHASIDGYLDVGSTLRVGYGGILSQGPVAVMSTGTSIFMGGVSSTAVTVNGVSVCLQNGTNCPAVGSFSWDALQFPPANNTYSLGSATGSLANIYASGTVVIGTHLTVGTSTVTPAANTIAEFGGTLNGWYQVNLQNRSSGNAASGDFVVTANNGSESSWFIDMGINSSAYNQAAYNIGGANDAYLYTHGRNLLIGTASGSASGTDGSIIFHTSGTTSGDERMRITSTGYVGIGSTAPTSTLTVAGSFSAGNAQVNTLTIGGKQVCLNDGTNCPNSSNTPGASFYAYDVAGNQVVVTSTAAGTAWTDVRLDTNGTVGSLYAHTAGTSTITISQAGLYRVTYSVSIYNASGTTATSGTTRFVRSTGGGAFTEVSGSKSGISTPAGLGASGGASDSFIFTAVAGDLVKLQVNKATTTVSIIKTLPNSASVVIETAVDTNYAVATDGSNVGYLFVGTSTQIQNSQFGRFAATIASTTNAANVTQGGLFVYTSSTNATSTFLYNAANNGKAVLDVRGGCTTGTNDLAVFGRTDDWRVASVRCNGQMYSEFGFSVASGADYAEYFPSREAALIKEGDVIALDNTTATSVVRGAVDRRAATIGVISKHSAYIGNAVLADDPNAVLVGMLGQLDTTVDAREEGIEIGDKLMMGADGHAVKAKGPGVILGTAMEALARGAIGHVMVYVNPSWWGGDLFRVDETGSVLVQDFSVASTTKASADVMLVDSPLFSFRGTAYDASTGAVMESSFSLNTVIHSTTSSLFTLSSSATSSPLLSVTELGDVMLSGKLYPSAFGAMQHVAGIYYDNSSSTLGDRMRTDGAGWGAEASGYAETYGSDDALIGGDVVVADLMATDRVKRSSTPYEDNVIGVVSNRPGFLAGHSEEGRFAVVVSGKAYVNVSTENGNIQIGDALVVSSEIGTAMRGTQAGPMIGLALEAFDGTSASTTILTQVRPGWFGGITASAVTASSNASSASTVATQGLARIFAGESSVQVSFASVGTYPLITITPYSTPGHWWISNQSDTGFTISIDEPLDSDLMFAWSVSVMPQGTTVWNSDGTSDVVNTVTGQAIPSAVVPEEPSSDSTSTGSSETPPSSEPSSDVESPPTTDTPVVEPVVEPIVEEPIVEPVTEPVAEPVVETPPGG
ncbi:MAG: hypothetical protein KIH65_003265 [Candidatus Uhrbacteria bacterium]|nr:hypothetical protein [Candidatus Uhrbacteria bacterium]